MINDLFNIMLNAPDVNILYISFPNPASAVFPRTYPRRQNASGASSRTAAAPEPSKNHTFQDLAITMDETRT